MKNIRKDFPILSTQINNKPLIYLDSASTAQKPQAVIDAIAQFYTHENANVHRNVYTLAERATQAYENARAVVAQFINAQPDEIVFTRGTTESINLMAESLSHFTDFPHPSTSFDTFLLTQKHSGRAENDAFTTELSRSIREDGKSASPSCLTLRQSSGLKDQPDRRSLPSPKARISEGWFEGSTGIQKNFKISAGDEILITELEHHSNMIPWQQLAQRKQARLNYIPINHDGTLNLSSISELINQRTKIVAVSHVSNVLGVHNPIKEIIDRAHAVGAYVLIDAAQSVAHQPIDVKKMDCDFLAFSGHKMFGPTGIGVLYIKKEIAQIMPPYQVGGGMVNEVALHEASWRQAPHKFEAGTPAIAQAIGLAAAIEYIQNNIDWAELRAHEAQLCTRTIEGLSKVKGVRILGPLDQLKKVGHMVTFTVDGVHAHDVAAYLDQYGICVRAGHHCAQPLAKRLGIDASIRVSFHGYNTMEDVETFLHAMDGLKI